MEIDLYKLVEDTGFNKMITVKKLSELSEMNRKLDDIRGSGNSSIDDIYNIIRNR